MRGAFLSHANCHGCAVNNAPSSFAATLSSHNTGDAAPVVLDLGTVAAPAAMVVDTKSLDAFLPALARAYPKVVKPVLASAAGLLVDAVAGTTRAVGKRLGT